MRLRIFIISSVLMMIWVAGCKTQKQKLEEEARGEATKFWESQVFSKCGGEYGDYFGRQGNKIYEFRSPIVIALSAEEERRPGVDWMGTTTVLSTGVRTFENGKWSDWQELKPVASRLDASGKRTHALVDDEGRWAIIGKDTGAGWSHVYFAPNEYHPISCSEIEPLPK